ncbi:hypothetical protein ACFSTE_01015 [Aquimarina hainanensis]|uniref:Uncharacterized protein n=1 Tax=Aquimarina hainanensis TaxID=1578017 RepID=A0ABW5N1J6_9FLAO|nr:hypothetical protein [Aquimarina sp. TRL1]QKX04497.1 hypothetical protein HN014_06075 [Aquimarina sp. TRL1]
MKKVLKTFLLIHFFIIILSSTFLFLNSYLEFHHKTKIENPVVNGTLDYILNNPIIKNYRILSGTNTGYGFYGINVATEKFFVVEVLDKDCNKIKEVTTFGLHKKNSLSRFQVLSSGIFNLISENRHRKKELKKKPSKALEAQAKFDDKYVDKIFKYVGLTAAKNTRNAAYYNVKLLALHPKEIWKEEQYDQKTSAFIYKQIEYDLSQLK